MRKESGSRFLAAKKLLGMTEGGECRTGVNTRALSHFELLGWRWRRGLVFHFLGPLPGFLCRFVRAAIGFRLHLVAGFLTRHFGGLHFIALRKAVIFDSLPFFVWFGANTGYRSCRAIPSRNCTIKIAIYSQGWIEQ